MPEYSLLPPVSPAAFAAAASPGPATITIAAAERGVRSGRALSAGVQAVAALVFAGCAHRRATDRIAAG